MGDQRLRDLERRWKETGSPDDEAAYLLERVRVGDLSRERLELAAYCGHEGARRAVSDSLELSDPVAWLCGLVRWGPPYSALALLELLRPLSSIVHSQLGYETPTLEFQAAAEAWCRCPCLAHAVTMGDYFSVLGPDYVHESERAQEPRATSELEAGVRAQGAIKAAIYFGATDHTPERAHWLTGRTFELLGASTVLGEPEAIHATAMQGLRRTLPDFFAPP